ncbi:MAG: hypothetical protein ACOYWZ_17405 [Bacillota bacterium]
MAYLTIDLDVGKEAVTSKRTEKEKIKSAVPEMSSGIANVFKALGIGSAITAIVSIIKTFKPLMSMLSALFKMIMTALSPIADVVMVLLYPILLMLKPIVIAINQIMMPFFKQAMRFMREGVEEKNAGKLAAGFSIIMTGIQAIVLYLAGEFIKMIATIFMTGVAILVGLFSKEAGNAIQTQIIPGINGFIDAIIASGIAYLALEVVSLGDSLNSDMSNFKVDIISAIDNVFPSLSSGFIDGLDKALNLVETDGIASAMTKLTETTGAELDSFSKDISTGIGAAFDGIIKAFNEEMTVSIDSLIVKAKEKGISFAKKAATYMLAPTQLLAVTYLDN